MTRWQREHQATGVRSSEGWIKPPQALQRQMTGDFPGETMTAGIEPHNGADDKFPVHGGSPRLDRLVRRRTAE